MTKFPEKTRCSHGGFGQNRLDKCDATKSKSGKHRNFHHSSAFIQVVRGMLNTRTFGDGDGEEEEDRHLTEAEVDRIIAEAAAPVDADARLVCGFCRNRVVAACLQLAQQLATETPVPPPPPCAEVGAAASASGPTARTSGFRSRTATTWT